MLLELDLDSDSEEGGEATVAALLDAFGEWMVAGRRPGVEWAVAETLRFKAGYLDGRLGCWQRWDLEEILTELFPRKVTADVANVALVVPTLRAFFEWLEQAGLLDPAGDPLPALHAELDRIEPQLLVLMTDESRYGMAKSMCSSMLADGVDIQNEDAVQGWSDAFNARQAARSLPSRGTLPPMAIPDEEALAGLASVTPALTRLRELAGFVGAGRRLTTAGNLRLADGKTLVSLLGTGDAIDPPVASRVVVTRSSAQLPEVDLTFRWAVHADFLAVDGGKVVPGPAVDELATVPLEAWRRALLALLDLGVLGGVRRIWEPFWTECLDESIVPLLCQLHARGPATVEELAAEAFDELDSVFDLSDIGEHVEARVLGDVLGIVNRLAQLGAVELTDRRVRLAPLGAWFIRTILELQGYEVPVVGRLADADAETLITTCARWDPDLAADEISG